MSTDSRRSDSRTFKYIVSNVSRWIDIADALVRTAYKLETDSSFTSHRFRNVYNMLIGFALENYYKGAIIANRLKTGEHIEAGKLDENIKKHQLIELALDAGVVLKDRLHKSYLEYIIECVTWRGRYPSPTTASSIGGSIAYLPPKEGGKIVLLMGIEHRIPIDAVHELIDQAKSNVELKRHPEGTRLLTRPRVELAGGERTIRPGLKTPRFRLQSVFTLF